MFKGTGKEKSFQEWKEGRFDKILAVILDPFVPI